MTVNVHNLLKAAAADLRRQASDIDKVANRKSPPRPSRKRPSAKSLTKAARKRKVSDKKYISPEGKARIAKAARKRWAEWRKAKRAAEKVKRKIGMVAAGMLSTLALLGAPDARAQATAPAPKVLLCPRQGVDAAGKPFDAAFCVVKFIMPSDGSADTLVARRKDNAATIVRASGATAGSTVTLRIPFPPIAEELRFEVVSLKSSAADPLTTIVAANAAPQQVAFGNEGFIPALTPAKFFSAFIEALGGATTP